MIGMVLFARQAAGAGTDALKKLRESHLKPFMTFGRDWGASGGGLSLHSQPATDVFERHASRG